MNFAPRPENDFAEFIRHYYEACRFRFDRIEAIAGKWMFRDLIPGMSDFDTRFVTSDDLDVDDWLRMSSAVAEVHLEFCEKYPCWARNLEHLPGINLTWSELTSERSYYPEYQQWTFYHSIQPWKVHSAIEKLHRRTWNEKDEYFHLKKFCLYFGRYDRSIDPAINLGVHENKYPLHSRIMHYFNPPVLAAVCLHLKRNLPGKMDAFEIAERLFPSLRCWELVSEILHANYETPKWYLEPALSELEDELEQGLFSIGKSLRDSLTIIPKRAGFDVAAWKEELQCVSIDPAFRVLDNAKFARLMKGRLWFYCRAPAYFESDWLIRNELNRMGENLFGIPFRTYWEIKTGEEVQDPTTILGELENGFLGPEAAHSTREFARLASEPCKEGKERERAAAIVETFDGFYRALHKISQDI